MNQIDYIWIGIYLCGGIDILMVSSKGVRNYAEIKFITHTNTQKCICVSIQLKFRPTTKAHITDYYHIVNYLDHQQ